MDHEALHRAIARLALIATEDVPARVVLRELCDVAAAVIDVDGVGVMLSDIEGNTFVHATNHSAGELERVQQALREGPCRDAARSATLVVASSSDEIERWPGFAATAALVGITAVAAVPLMSRGRCWGVLDLYRTRPGPWDAELLSTAQLLADVSTSHLVMAADRDSAREARAELQHQSSHDALTGAANRVLLFDRLGHALEMASRHGTAVGVLFLDIDDFKQVNDVYGHAAGDEVLRETARRVSLQLRDADTFARLSGDEFVVVCEDLPFDADDTPSGTMREVAGRIHAAVSTPVAIPPVYVTVTMSIGAAVASGSIEAEELVAEADRAMYEAKASSSARLQVRDYTGGATPQQNRELEHRLARALERRQLVVYFQPIVVGPQPLTVSAVEALLRWDDPTTGILPAARFIDVAVSRGMMSTFGAWVIDQVCAQMTLWLDEFGDRAPQTAYLNLSAREINDPALPGVLSAALRRHSLDARHIGLEIIEDDLAHVGLVARLKSLRSHGHPLSIDDFGTGFSSLSRLLDLEADIAKIDQAFVAGVPRDRRRAAFIQAVLTIAASLDISVVAEGVETAEQQDFLLDAGCTYLQGHLIGRPEPAAVLSRALRSTSSS